MDNDRSMYFALELTQGFVATGKSSFKAAREVARLPLEDRNQISGDFKKIKSESSREPTEGESAREIILIDLLGANPLSYTVFEQTIAGKLPRDRPLRKRRRRKYAP